MQDTYVHPETVRARCSLAYGLLSEAYYAYHFISQSEYLAAGDEVDAYYGWQTMQNERIWLTVRWLSGNGSGVAAARENAVLEAAQQPTHGAAALKDFADDAPAYAVGDTVTYMTISGNHRTIVVTERCPDTLRNEGFRGIDSRGYAVWGYDSDILSVTPAAKPMLPDTATIIARDLTYERERAVRNREREFAKNCGWREDRYWETADWKDLEREQLKYDNEK